MRINNNISALNTYNRLGVNATGSSKSMEKLSSGMRINRASDDAAGLAISEKMRAQIRGLNQASRNAQDTISLIQTAEGALNETHSILQRMRELAIQAANDTNTDTDRQSLQAEINQLVAEIDRIGNSTEFNTMKLLNGDKAGVQAGAKGYAEIESSIANSAVTVTLGGAALSNANITNVIKINVVGIVSNTPLSTGGLAHAKLSFNFAINAAINGVVLTTGPIIQFSGFYSNQALQLSIGNGTKLTVGDTIVLSVNKKVSGNTDAGKELVAQIGANATQEMRIGIDDMRATALNLKTSDGDIVDVTTKGKAAASVKLINTALETVSTHRSKLGAYQNRLEHTITNLQTSSENLTASESRIRDVDMANEMMSFTKYNILNQAATAMLAQANQLPQNVLQLLR